MRTFSRIAFSLVLPLALRTVLAGEAPPSPITSSTFNMKTAGLLDTSEHFDDASAAPNYDEVVRDLVDQLMNRRKTAKKREIISAKRKKEEEDRDAANEKEQFTVNAQDAARKLAGLGKRAVPDLTLLFRANYNRPAKELGAERAAQVAWYSAWALSRIRTREAAQALLPLILDAGASQDLRLMAVEASGWEKSDDGIAVLEKVATTDPDIEMRKHALGQLSMIPEFWVRTEPIFVRALYDPNEEIRVQAAKACHYSHMFKSANPKLIELLEKDPSANVRLYAMLTLTRLRVVLAEPALVRIIQATNSDEKLRKLALASLVTISDIPFRNAESALSWWDKKGRAELDEFNKHEKLVDQKIAESEKAPAIKTAPKRKSLDGPFRVVGAMGTANSAPEPAPEKTLPDAAIKTEKPRVESPNVEPNFEPKPEPKVEPQVEVVPLDKPKINDAPVNPGRETPVDALKEPVKTVEPTPAVPVNPPNEKLNPNESSGSQRRRMQQKQGQQ